jgi:hypothetical protein
MFATKVEEPKNISPHLRSFLAFEHKLYEYITLASAFTKPC